MSPNNELYSLCRDGQRRFSIHILITRASEICYSFYLILQWKSGIISQGKILILRLSLSPYSKMVFLERGKISKGLIKKSYWAELLSTGRKSKSWAVRISPAISSSTGTGSVLLQSLDCQVLKATNHRGQKSWPLLHKRSPGNKNRDDDMI